jgi:hypothetical protein
VLFLTSNEPAGAGAVARSRYSFGGVDALGTQFSSWYGNRVWSSGAIIAARGMFSTRAITCAEVEFLNPSSPPTTTLTGAATATIVDTGCLVDWSVCDGVAREVLWFAFGVAAGGPAEVCVPGTTITLAQGGGGSAGSANTIPLGAAGNTPGAVVD